MLLTVNGETVELTDGATLAELLRRLGIQGTVALERNGDIVRRDQQRELQLREGDILEIVQFVGGG